MTDITGLLGAEGAALLQHVCKGIPKESLHLPGPDFVDRVFAQTDRSPAVLRSLQQMFDHGRLAGTGYLSILPVDQGIEHSAGASFAPNPIYFDPENIVKLAIEGGCNAVASTLGVLGIVARKYAHKIPVHREDQPQRAADLSQQVRPDLVRPASGRRPTWARSAVGATIYFGSPESGRQIVEVSARRSQHGARAGHGDGAVVLPAQQRVQDRRQGLPRVGRPDRPGEPPRRDDRGRHHQAEAAGEQRRLSTRSTSGRSVRQDRQAGVHRADQRPPDRPDALPGRQLLHGPHRAHQLRRRLGRERPARGGAHRGDQQARRRHGPDLRAARRSRSR